MHFLLHNERPIDLLLLPWLNSCHHMFQGHNLNLRSEEQVVIYKFKLKSLLLLGLVNLPYSYVFRIFPLKNRFLLLFSDSMKISFGNTNHWKFQVHAYSLDQKINHLAIDFDSFISHWIHTHKLSTCSTKTTLVNQESYSKTPTISNLTWLTFQAFFKGRSKIM